MTNEPVFIDIWRRFDDYELDVPTIPLCKYAEAFSNWAESALYIEGNVSLVQLNQAKILLVDKYFQFFSIAPKNHRYYFNPKNHICIFQVFLEYYRRIRTRELGITPPMLFIPPPPLPPPPPPQIAGIVFGEDDE